MKNIDQNAPNVLEMIPQHNIKFQKGKDGIELLEPRFKSQFSQKFIARYFKKKHFIIHLDEFGSFVWNSIDGTKTVLVIADELLHHFGKDIDPVYERLGLFVNMLAQRNFIKLNTIKGF